MKYQQGGQVSIMDALKNALLLKPTGTAYDKVPLPSNELGVLSELKGVGIPAFSFLKSIFGKKNTTIEKIINHSDIDWQKWNKEIPNDKKLLEEYHTLEKVTKENGTWMKNSDGSPFVGLPEQFVQQQSSNFKKAYPQGFEEVYRGVAKYNKELIPNRALFTANKDLAKGYGDGRGQILSSTSNTQGGLYNLYKKNSRNSIEFDALENNWDSIDLTDKQRSISSLEYNLKKSIERVKSVKDELSKMVQHEDGSWGIPGSTEKIGDNAYKNMIPQLEERITILDNRRKNANMLVANPEEFKKMRDKLGNTTTTDNIANYISEVGLDNVKLNNIYDAGLGNVSIVNNKPGNYLKSAIGNNGMFNMNNPNPFNAIFPFGVAAYYSKTNNRQYGGIINKHTYGGMTTNNRYNLIPDDLLIQKMGLGGFFKNIWRGLGTGADGVLSNLGMPNVIQNSGFDTLVEKHPGIGKIANISSGILKTGLNFALPGIGAAFTAGTGLINSVTSANKAAKDAAAASDTPPIPNTSNVPNLDMTALYGPLSELVKGFKGQQQYDMSNVQDPMIETPGYQEGGDVNQMMQDDPWLKARGQIESSGNQDSTSSAGAVGMFQITPIALKEYNRKYDANYTWDQVRTNAATNAHVSNGLIKDIRKMIDKVDTNLSDFDKNVLSEMATNYGPYRFIDKLKAKGKDVTLEDMLNEKSLPSETRNHGKKFVDYFDKNKPMYSGDKVLAPRDATKVIDTSPKLGTFKGDPYEYKKEGENYYYKKSGSSEYKPINAAGKMELQRRKFQYGGFTGKVSQRDSVANMVDKTMQYEALRGGAKGTQNFGLSNWGYNQSQLPYNQAPSNWTPPQSRKEAVELYMKEIAPKLDHFQTAMEKGEAGDFLYNTGRDPRVYMLDQYLKSKGITSGLPDRGSYNIDIKTQEWDNKKYQFEKEWNKHKDDINSLPENDRRILLNKGRDFYYKNINKKADGSPSDAYSASWKGRIWNTNDYKPFNPNNPKFQYGGIINVLDTIANTFKAPIGNMIPDSVYDMALDPKKHYISATPDQSLLRSGLRRVYSKKDNKQIGLINREGQFMITPQDGTTTRFEGYPSAMNLSLQNIAQKQMGGNINTTGYTPGTPTMQNDHNIIPSNQITMEKTPFPVNAFPMNQNGQLSGRPVTMKPGEHYYFPNATSVLEIPKAQDGMTIGEGGFYRRKGDNWGYKQNQDGTYTTIDFNRNGRQFNVTNPNSGAYQAIAKLFAQQSVPMAQLPTSQSNPYAGNQIPNSTMQSSESNIDPMHTIPTPQDKDPMHEIPVKDTHQSFQGFPNMSYYMNKMTPEQNKQGLELFAGAAGGELLGGIKVAPYLAKALQGAKYEKMVNPTAWNTAKAALEELSVAAKKIHPIDRLREIFSGSKKIKSANNYKNMFKYGGIAKYQEGGEVEQFTPIQTEKGERFLHTDMSISNTAAKKLHKNMSDDEITDIVPDGTFVASRDPEMRISKKEADNIVLGNYALKYIQGKVTELPKDIRFSDLFTKRFHTPSELLDKIDKKFKLVDKPHDVFTRDANSENLESRRNWSDVIKYMTDVKKPAEVGTFKYGGNVRKYQDGSTTNSGKSSLFLQLLPGLLQLLPQVGATAIQASNQKKSLEDIGTYSTQNQGYLKDQYNVNNAANILGYSFQDSTPEMYNVSQPLNEITNPYQKAISDISNRQEANLNLARGTANDAYSRLANVDPRLAYTSASTIGSNAYRGAQQANLALLDHRDSLATSLGQQRSNLIRESLLNRQQTLAGVRSNRNQLNAGLFGNMAQSSNDYYSGLNNVANTTLAARMGARGQYANFLTNMGYGLSNSLGNIGQAIANFGRPSTTSNSYNPVNYGATGVPSYTVPGQQFTPGTNLTGNYGWPK